MRCSLRNCVPSSECAIGVNRFTNTRKGAASTAVKPSESIDHVLPRSRGGLSVTENCVPSCLSCNGHKSDSDAFQWYRRQRFYDPRRAMAIRAWLDGDLRLAIRLLQWATPDQNAEATIPQANLNLQAA